jgi:hypothetical protein
VIARSSAAGTAAAFNYPKRSLPTKMLPARNKVTTLAAMIGGSARKSP